MKINKQGIQIADDIKGRKYIVSSRLFDEVDAAACPCVGQVSTNSKMLAYFLYHRWKKFSYNHAYSIAVSLYKKNENGKYDAIER